MPMTSRISLCFSPILRVFLKIHQWEESGLHRRCACTPKAQTGRRHRENGPLKPVNGTYWQEHPCVALATWQDRYFEADFILDIMRAEGEPGQPQPCRQLFVSGRLASCTFRIPKDSNDPDYWERWRASLQTSPEAYLFFNHAKLHFSFSNFLFFIIFLARSRMQILMSQLL